MGPNAMRTKNNLSSAVVGSTIQERCREVGIHVKSDFLPPKGDRVELKKFGKWHGSSVTVAHRNARGTR